MDNVFVLATEVLERLVKENREPSDEEKALLVKMGITFLFDVHSIAVSLDRIAEAMSELNEYGEGPVKAIGANIARALRNNG